jgi:hypothetical protein
MRDESSNKSAQTRRLRSSNFLTLLFFIVGCHDRLRGNVQTSVRRRDYAERSGHRVLFAEHRSYSFREPRRTEKPKETSSKPVPILEYWFRTHREPIDDVASYFSRCIFCEGISRFARVSNKFPTSYDSMHRNFGTQCCRKVKKNSR